MNDEFKCLHDLQQIAEAYGLVESGEKFTAAHLRAYLERVAYKERLLINECKIRKGVLLYPSVL